MKPIILITASLAEDEKFLKLNRAYTAAIERAGGVAMIPDCANIENIKYYLEYSNGVLLTGGGDVEPSFFGEAPIKETGEASPERDAFEIALTLAAIDKKVPVLGICRGMQVMNIALGGKIYQDIYAQNNRKNIIKHSQEMPGHYGLHTVDIAKGTRLYEIFGDSAFVNSFHHQAVSVPGDGVRVTAAAPDGIIEAIELKNDSFSVGVQWHPEKMIKNDINFVDNRYQSSSMTKNDIHFKIFDAFIRAAKNIL